MWDSSQGQVYFIVSQQYSKFLSPLIRLQWMLTWEGLHLISSSPSWENGCGCVARERPCQVLYCGFPLPVSTLNSLQLPFHVVTSLHIRVHLGALHLWIMLHYRLLFNCHSKREPFNPCHAANNFLSLWHLLCFCWLKSPRLRIEEWHFLLQLPLFSPVPHSAGFQNHLIWRDSQKGPTQTTKIYSLMCVQTNHFAFCGNFTPK